jgi:hypothetical protein
MRFAEADDRVEAGVAAPPVRRAGAHPGRSRAAGPSSTASRAVATSCAAPAAAALAAVAAAGGAARRALRQRARRVSQARGSTSAQAAAQRNADSRDPVSAAGVHGARAARYARPCPRQAGPTRRTRRRAHSRGELVHTVWLAGAYAPGQTLLQARSRSPPWACLRGSDATSTADQRCGGQAAARPARGGRRSAARARQSSFRAAHLRR